MKEFIENLRMDSNNTNIVASYTVYDENNGTISVKKVQG